jgi:hypothetical protein
MYENPNCAYTKFNEPLAFTAAFLAHSVHARLHCPFTCAAGAASTEARFDAKRRPGQWQADYRSTETE